MSMFDENKTAKQHRAEAVESVQAIHDRFKWSIRLGPIVAAMVQVGLVIFGIATGNLGPVAVGGVGLLVCVPWAIYSWVKDNRNNAKTKKHVYDMWADLVESQEKHEAELSTFNADMAAAGDDIEAARARWLEATDESEDTDEFEILPLQLEGDEDAED